MAENSSKTLKSPKVLNLNNDKVKGVKGDPGCLISEEEMEQLIAFTSHNAVRHAGGPWELCKSFGGCSSNLTDIWHRVLRCLIVCAYILTYHQTLQFCPHVCSLRAVISFIHCVIHLAAICMKAFQLSCHFEECIVNIRLGWTVQKSLSSMTDAPSNQDLETRGLKRLVLCLMLH